MNVKIHFQFPFRFILLASLLLSLVGGAVLTTPAYAATLTVTTTDDSGPGSLRQALLDANNGDVIDATGISGTITLASQLTVDDDVTINGPGAASLTVCGNNAVRVFFISTGKTVTINNLTIEHGKMVDNNGGGIYNMGFLALNHVAVSSNTVEKSITNVVGGGIYSGTGSSLTVMNSTIDHNTANDMGGGIIASEASIHLENVTINSNQVLSGSGEGGGIAILSSPSALLNKVTLSGNSAELTGGGLYSNVSLALTNSLVISNNVTTNNPQTNAGGGLSFDGANQTFDLTNVTVAINSAATGNGNGNGGGIGLWSGTLNIINVTLAGNSADQGGGIWKSGGSGKTINMLNTILSNNTTAGSGLPNNCNGEINSLGYNLIKDVNCTIVGDTTGNLTGVDPMLGALADNGGPTETMALLTGSPAINAGTNTGCPATDQRGVTRPFGATCDMGAYEVNQGVVTYRSSGAQDGWALESTETSGKGGTMDSAATVFRLGDDVGDRQYRGILSFDTSSLPDTAVITKITLKMRQQGLAGTNPFTSLGQLRVDIRKPFFGATAGLAAHDFQGAASKNNIGAIPNTPVSGWYSKVWTVDTFFSFVNRTGTTQFRLRFLLGDNDNGAADYLKFYSGNVGAASRPQLIIEYYVP
ncbi:MAG: hypothetical protein HY867_13920 [Chloroflexi bacterium]|nr:hypothetical protein [Chloroflexota bacterium]